MRVHVLISGLVQGVFFRASTEAQANALGVNGWVKNTLEGKVEAVFEGPKDKVEQMVEWCREGPPFAKVDKVDVQKEIEGNLQGFEIRYS